MRRLLPGASLQGEVRIFLFFKAKVNFENDCPVEEGFFWWLQWLKHLKEGGYFGMRDKQANRSSKLVTPSVYKLKVIHPGFYFNGKATKPADTHLRWMPWNKRISSGQRSSDQMPAPRVGTEARDLPYQQSGCQAQRKERATAAALAGREQKQALNAPALWTFITFVYVLLSFHRPKNWKPPSALFSPTSPNPTTSMIWPGRKEAI